MPFKKIAPEELKENNFSLIANQWYLITVGNLGKFNMMTASWGGLGELWNKPVATIYVRPQRYTREFIEKSDYFTMSFFDEAYRPQLDFCGAKSGRDVDKVKETGLTPVEGPGGSVYFREARLVLVCRKIYWHDLDPERFLSDDIGKNYPGGDYHRMYIGEALEVLVNQK